MQNNDALSSASQVLVTKYVRVSRHIGIVKVSSVISVSESTPEIKFVSGEVM